MVIPIWKDYTVDLGNYEYRDFRITCGSVVVYSGRAYRRPSRSTISIRINDICADYLHNSLPGLTNAELTPVSSVVTFTVDTYSGSAWGTVDTVTFANDWSYDYSHDPGTDGMSFPIDGRLSPMQYLMYTTGGKDTFTATLTYRDGTKSVIVFPIKLYADYNADYNDDYSIQQRLFDSGTGVIDLSQYDGLASIDIEGRHYVVVDTCSRYVLYYVNAYGGWDSLVMEGTPQEKDSLTRHTVKKEYDNADVKARGTENYVNEIEKTWTLRSGWLTDSMASRMHNLLNATTAYMHDLQAGQVLPVILTGTASEYKTYRNQGNRMFNYEVEVQLAQERTRR